MKEKLKNIFVSTGLYDLYKFFRYFNTEKLQRRKYRSIYKQNIITCLCNQFDPLKKTIFVDFHDPFLSIYIIALLYAFGKKGYNIVLKNNYHFISNTNLNKAYIYQLDFVTIQKKIRPDKNSPVFFDKSHLLSAYSNCNKAILFSEDIFFRKSLSVHEMILPFTQHPETFISGQFEKIKEYRYNSKLLWCFFSGNYDFETYTKPIHKDFFKVDNRYELINEIKKEFPPELLTIVTEASDLFAKKNVNRHNLVITDWSWHPKKISSLHSRINNEEWLSTLSQAVFFIALPGVHMPMCHNIIEAMSVGTIPILEYADHFYPELTHNENSIIFKGKQDLVEKLKFVLTLNEEEVKRMRNNALEYYEQYLNIESVVSKIIGNTVNNLTMYYFDEYKSVDAYRNRK
jgi:glycosyltransferase involved in cell wall biosynthesis